MTPKFPFGHGLSYTSFLYSNLQADAAGMKVSVDITNTGNVTGAEVAQLYLVSERLAYALVHCFTFVALLRSGLSC